MCKHEPNGGGPGATTNPRVTWVKLKYPENGPKVLSTTFYYVLLRLTTVCFLHAFYYFNIFFTT